MLVDGKNIAAAICAEVKEKLEKSGQHPCLTVFTCAPNAETQKYLELKKKRAQELGIDVMVIELDREATTKDALSAVASAHSAEGIIIQLPFPSQIDVSKVLAAIPKELDVDAIHYQGEETEVLPPVIGAVSAIAKTHGVEFKGKSVVVVGQGRLVGQPAVLWAKAQGATVTVVDKDTNDSGSILRDADIIISGAGQPGLITADKIKDGVIIFDAGTSEEGGELKGDADPSCAVKAALFTPVPGGIGPITIAVLLWNLMLLSERHP